MKHVRVTLLDVYQAGQLALDFARDVPSAAALQDDLKTRAAVLHQLLVLGEAVKRLPDSFRAGHPAIPWRQMSGLRDVLIHAYDAVDEEEVWRVLQHDLPTVLAQLEPLLPPIPE
ncbi:MAG: DUF86 domain-containing protein [Rhodothermales bacterium]